MTYILDGLYQAAAEVLSFNRELFSVVSLSLLVSTTATGLAALVGVPVGFAIGAGDFRGRRALITAFNSLMALPTVVVGLVVYCMLARKGPLGPLDLLFTPSAMVIGEFILALPIVVALTISAVQSVDPRLQATILSLGAGRLRGMITVLQEARFSIMAAVVASFGRVIAEVGSAMIVGGNIKGYTRTMTTAIALETSKGEFSFAIALGFILLAVAFTVNLFFHSLQGSRG